MQDDDESVLWIRIWIYMDPHHFGNLDQHSDPHPHQGEKSNPDPQRYSIYLITYAPGHLMILHKKAGQICDLEVRVADPDPHSIQLLERCWSG